MAGAAENMAADFLLLRRYPGPAFPRFRHYGWRAPSWTFGYGQKIAEVRAALPRDGSFDLCRRPTGGGLVDHREDWTYMVVIPRGHPLEEQRAAESYRAIHLALARALSLQGVGAALETRAPGESGGGANACFAQAEIHDVVLAASRTKLAGAAQKRTRDGQLFQGSIARVPIASVAPRFDWDAFHEAFTGALGATLDAEAVPHPWPEFADGEWEALTEQYGSTEWLEHR